MYIDALSFNSFNQRAAYSPFQVTPPPESLLPDHEAADTGAACLIFNTTAEEQSMATIRKQEQDDVEARLSTEQALRKYRNCGVAFLPRSDGYLR